MRTQLSRGLARQPDLSWSRPARSYLANRGRTPSGRRLPWEPGVISAKSVPRLALIVDVSGSIDDSLLTRFATEIDALCRRRNADIVLVIGDHRVRQITMLVPGQFKLQAIRFDGAGGTDFTPLLEAANRLRPALGVVLTDLQGPADYRPSWPVLWAVPAAYRFAEQPFGRKLVLL